MSNHPDEEGECRCREMPQGVMSQAGYREQCASCMWREIKYAFRMYDETGKVK